MGSLDDRSGFHNLSLQPESWPLFGVSYDSTDYVCTTIPFGWNDSPVCYHSLSEAKSVHRRSRGIPVLAYIDDAWYGNFASTFRCSDKVQWLSAAEALHTGVLVSYFCGYLWDTKCDLKPSRIQRYLGILCDSSTPRSGSRKTSSRSFMPRSTQYWSTVRSPCRCWRKSRAIASPRLSRCDRRPCRRTTMFGAIAKANGREIHLSNKPDLCADLNIWRSLSATAQEGPWNKLAPIRLTGYRRRFRRVVQQVGRSGVDARRRILRERGVPSRVVVSAHQRKRYVCAARRADGVRPRTPRTTPPRTAGNGCRKSLRGRRV